MKKLFTLFAAAMAMLSAQATDYTCNLKITLMGMEVESKTTTVSVDEQAAGTYTLNLKNFTLDTMDLPVGTISVNNVEGIPCGNTTVIKTAQTIQIDKGDDPNVEEWQGPSLGDVPITLLGEIKGSDIKAVLNISFGGLAIGVELGNGTESLGQLPNAGFNKYHTAKYSTSTSEEPNGWHSFMSSTGTWASAVSSAAHTFIVEEGAPESTDNKSVQIKSTSVLKVKSANGTITTGRLNAGNVSATHKDNNSFSDLSNTSLDENGDPFYTVLTTKPDGIKTWLKYKVGARSKTNKNVYATISAIINDGTKVQDPEVSNYASSIIARAQNAQIESKNEEWQVVEIPFTYTENTNQPKAILVTMSTCSVASGGSTSDSDPDILTVDSVALVYNCNLTSLKYKDQAITLDESGSGSLTLTGDYSENDFHVTTDGAGAIVSKLISVDEDTKAVTLTVIVTAGDLKNANTYTVNIEGGKYVSGINNASASTKNSVMSIYNAAGQRISTMQRGLNIIRKDGKTIKLIQK